jgi:hypothetical protein
MQIFTHFLIGIFIYDLITNLTPSWPFWLQIAVIAFLAFLSHFFIDSIATMTYHPPEPLWKDRFWVIYHMVVINAISLILLILLFRPYWWIMMIGSLFPDIIDWYFLRLIFKKGPIFHPIIDRIRDAVFAWIPKWYLKNWAVLIEFALDILIGIGIWLL